MTWMGRIKNTLRFNLSQAHALYVLVPRYSHRSNTQNTIGTPAHGVISCGLQKHLVFSAAVRLTSFVVGIVVGGGVDVGDVSWWCLVLFIGRPVSARGQY